MQMRQRENGEGAVLILPNGIEVEASRGGEIVP
jgi:hypothetical protein